MVTEQQATRKLVLVIGVLVAVLASGCADVVATPSVTPSPSVTVTLIPELTPTPAPPLQFEILGLNSYEDPVGSLRFLLEVRNMNDFDVESVGVTLVLEDADGRVVGSRHGYAKLDVLGRGDTAPIMVVFFLEAPEFSEYDLRIEGREAGYVAGLLHPELRVVGDFGRVGQWVPYEVLGEVHNVGDRDAESVTLVVACYDAGARVVAVGSGRPTERMIPAGASSEFLVSMGAVASDITGCKVQVEGLIVNQR